MDLSRLPEVLRQPLRGGVSSRAQGTILAFDPERMWKIAKSICEDSLKITSGDRLLLKYHAGGRQLAAMIAYISAAKGAAVIPRCDDQYLNASIFNGIEDKRTPYIFEELSIGETVDIAWAEKVMFVRCVEDPALLESVSPDIQAEYMRTHEPPFRIRVDRRQWCLIYIPTTGEADRDGMVYDQYVDTFLNACDRPWSKVYDAQELLCHTYLNPGKELILRAGREGSGGWRTELKMNIEGQTFANSTIDVNFPGSEVFSSPVRGSIEGIFELPYPVMFSGRALPGMRLVFKEGRVVEHWVDPKDSAHPEWLASQLNVDPGAVEVGEVALGTNPALSRPFLNTLFVEKVGGSFHIALGNAYAFESYGETPVKVDNGVRSAIHADLTCMMLPEFGGGEVVVDGKVIQRDGKFLDPKLALLCRIG